MNVIDEATAETMDPKSQLAPCSTKFLPYGEEIKTPIGQFTARAWYKGKECQAGFVVVRGKGECLMSYHTKFIFHFWFAVELVSQADEHDRRFVIFLSSELERVTGTQWSRYKNERIT